METRTLTLDCRHGPYDGVQLTLPAYQREIVVKMFERSTMTYLYRVVLDDCGQRYLSFAGASEVVSA